MELSENSDDQNAIKNKYTNFHYYIDKAIELEKENFQIQLEKAIFQVNMHVGYNKNDKAEGFKTLAKIITSADDFEEVANHLTPEQVGILFNEIIEKLPQFMISIDDFQKVNEHLSEEQRGIFFKAVIENLPEITKLNPDFKKVDKHLSEQQRTMFHKAIEEKSPKTIKQGNNSAMFFSSNKPDDKEQSQETQKPKIT